MREKSIDGKIIKNAIGFCHYEAHPGALNRELARKHKCVQKRCRHLEKYSEDAWRQKPLYKNRGK